MPIQEGSHRRATVLAVITAAAVLLSGCTSLASADPSGGGAAQVQGPFPADVTERLDAALADAMALSGSSGAIAGVWAPWAGQWVVAPGTTTRDGQEPLSTDMRFRAASITKGMTCTVLLRLVDEGVVDLSDTVSEYLSRVGEAGDVTLGQLCQNTSGLADYTPQLAQHFVNNPTREWPPLELASNGLALERVAPPGGAFAESNTGYVLLGMALQAATRQDWPELYRRYIFEPLGMRDTSFPGPDQTAVPGAHPRGYAAALDPAGQLVCETVRDETQLSNSMTWVAGGVVSTVDDLRVWAQALAQGSLLSEKSHAAQWATVPLGAGASSWQGYGLGAQKLGPLRGQAGAIPGFLSAAFADPDTGLTVVVMLNNSSSGAGFMQSLAQRLASIASKAPAAGDDAAPLIELPWSEEQAVQALQAQAKCVPPAEPAAAG